ncbi:MAG: hypothetical protein ACR2KV_02695 [Solirubrobacteraceae bacterium]
MRVPFGLVVEGTAGGGHTDDFCGGDDRDEPSPVTQKLRRSGAGRPGAIAAG